MREIVRQYESASARLRRRVIQPRGTSGAARQWDQARSAAILSQVDQDIRQLKDGATEWTGAALQQSMDQGIATADEQAAAAGIRPPDDGGVSTRGALDVVDRNAVAAFARDTVRDLHKAADSMRSQAEEALKRMSATGVTTAEVNDILTRGVIDGQPVRAQRELREALRKVHGDKVTIMDKNGMPREFGVGHYAGMVARTKTRQATRVARHSRLQQSGVDLVVIIGRISKNFCTAYMDKVFSLSGEHPTFPPLATTPGGGPPYHPNCSKGTAPFVEALADPEAIDLAQPDDDTRRMLNERDRNALQQRFEKLEMGEAARKRHRKAERMATQGFELPTEHETTESADVFADRQYGAWAEDVREDAEMHDAVAAYQTNSRPFNEVLRERAPATREARAQIDALNAAIDAAPPLEEDTFAFRGTDHPQWHALADQFRERLDERFAGRVIRDRGFVSTSVTPDSAFEFLDRSHRDAPVFLRIVLPKGTKAAWVDGITDVGQAEFLLPQDAEFEVTQAITRTRNGRPHTHLTVRYRNAR